MESQQALRAKEFITVSSWSNMSHRKMLQAHTVHKPEKQHRAMGSVCAGGSGVVTASILNLTSSFTL